MKKIYPFVFALALCSGLAAQNYSSQNVTLLGHWFNPAEEDEPVYGISYQGCYGWHNPQDNREYAIIGGSSGTYFIDITNPTAPVQSDYVAGTHQNCIWHEVKTYDKYCYIISDDAPNNSFQIVDMSYLPDSVHVVYDGTSIFENSHTLFVDGNKLWCASVTLANSTYYSMAVYDLSNPVAPTLLRTLNQDYPAIGTVHDMFVRNDTCYASCGYDGLHIYKFGTNFTEIGQLTSYPDQGYNHSSFLTSDGKTLIFMDEVPVNRRVKSIDVTNTANISINQTFTSTVGCTPHNPYIIGNNTLVAAYYQDGLQIFNISNPSNIVRTGYFDTDTLNNQSNGYPQAYHGCWGAYEALPSGTIIASDMQNGLYLFDISQAILLNVPAQQSGLSSSANAYPNPFDNSFSVSLDLAKKQTVIYAIYDNTGRLVSEAQNEQPTGTSLLEIEAANFAAGIYTIKITGEDFTSSVKLIKN
jgi:choice-of-anchor B domain-containing protein